MSDCEYECVDRSLDSIDDSLDDKLNEIVTVARDIETRLRNADYYNFSIPSTSRRSEIPRALHPLGQFDRPLPDVPRQTSPSHDDQLYCPIDTLPEPPPLPPPSPCRPLRLATRPPPSPSWPLPSPSRPSPSPCRPLPLATRPPPSPSRPPPSSSRPPPSPSRPPPSPSRPPPSPIQPPPSTTRPPRPPALQKGHLLRNLQPAPKEEELNVKDFGDLTLIADDCEDLVNEIEKVKEFLNHVLDDDYVDKDVNVDKLDQVINMFKKFVCKAEA